MPSTSPSRRSSRSPERQAKASKEPIKWQPNDDETREKGVALGDGLAKERPSRQQDGVGQRGSSPAHRRDRTDRSPARRDRSAERRDRRDKERRSPRRYRQDREAGGRRRSRSASRDGHRRGGERNVNGRDGGDRPRGGSRSRSPPAKRVRGEDGDDEQPRRSAFDRLGADGNREREQDDGRRDRRRVDDANGSRRDKGDTDKVAAARSNGVERDEPAAANGELAGPSNGPAATADGKSEDATAAAATAGAAAPSLADAVADAVAAAAPEPRKPANLGRTGGVYLPPFKLARLTADMGSDKASAEYQRLTWEALKKSLNGIINKVNSTNIKNILPELLRENLVRGKGLLCRSLMKSQIASPSFTPVYAALLSVLNTKFPEIGELMLHRLVLQFARAFKRNDKAITTSAAKFIAHLVNQGVAHELLALEMLIAMLERVSDDSIEMATEFTKEVGAYLKETSPQAFHSVFERFRAVLHEGQVAKRSQFIVENLYTLRKANFDGFPSKLKELDLVDDEDQITHEISLEDKLDAQPLLDIFKEDPDYERHEREYAAIAREMLGEESESEGGGGGGDDGDKEDSGDEEGSDDEDDGGPGGGGGGGGQQPISDLTSTNLVNLRRTIYLTIMSSMDFEEAGHKLMKIGVPKGSEIELVTMVIECCSQERTYKRFFGLLAARFCNIDRTYEELYANCFVQQYGIIHRLETNKLRNVSSLFAHLLYTDSIPWGVLECIRLTEEDTTSSSRIFIKYLFQELSSHMGLVRLNERLSDPRLQGWFAGIFPRDTAANMRFSINFFTSIGLGGVTDNLRRTYKEAQDSANALLQAQRAEQAARAAASSSSDSDSDSSTSGSSSSDSSSSSSSSDSEDDRRRRGSKGGGGKKNKPSSSAKKKAVDVKGRRR